MPKIPWTPPERPPRRRPAPEPVSEPSDTRTCTSCLGEGVLYKGGAKGEPQTRVIRCWICNGTGEALPDPPAGDLHSDGARAEWQGAITWSFDDPADPKRVVYSYYDEQNNRIDVHADQSRTTYDAVGAESGWRTPTTQSQTPTDGLKGE